MNRIQHWIDEELQTQSGTGTQPANLAIDDAASADDLNGITRDVLSLGSPAAREETHCIFTPLHYERNYAYPLIVWLHGPRDNERQVAQVMPLVSMRNYIAVGPRGTVA